eukprot:6246509-Pyramimonas_sp.AAC.1
MAQLGFAKGKTVKKRKQDDASAAEGTVFEITEICDDYAKLAPTGLHVSGNTKQFSLKELKEGWALTTAKKNKHWWTSSVWLPRITPLTWWTW